MCGLPQDKQPEAGEHAPAKLDDALEESL